MFQKLSLENTNINLWQEGYFYKINQFDHIKLQNLIKRQPFWSSYQWLCCLDEMSEHKMIYLYIEDEKKNIIGFIPCQIIKDEKTLSFYNLPVWLTKKGIFWETQFFSENEKSELQNIQSILSQNMEKLYPSLMAACPNSYSAIGIDPTIDINAQEEVLRKLLILFDKVAIEFNCKSQSIPFIYQQQQQQLIKKAIQKSNYLQTNLLSDAVIHLNWTNFEDYLQQFSRKRRMSIQRELRVFSEAGYSIKVEQGDKALTDNLALLHISLREKYGICSDIDAIKKTYSIFRQYLDNEITVFIAEKNQVPVGFVLFFNYEHELYSRIVGFDYNKMGNDFCYFNLVYYQPIQWAINNHILSIHYGASSYEAKIKRGCVLDHSEGFVKFSGSLLKPASQALMFLNVNQSRYRNEINKLMFNKGGNNNER